MPVVRKEDNATFKSSKSNGEQICTRPSIIGRRACELSGDLGSHPGPRETVQPRRSVRLASRHKYAVPSDKPIVPSRCLLEREGPQRSFDAYKPVDPVDLPKQPAWPKFETRRGSGGHGNRKLQREYSFVLVDCGTHFEMVSPKAVNHFSRVPQCFGTMAPYHNFGSGVGEEELKKRLCARLVKKEDEEQLVTSAQKTVGAGQTRKRGRAEDEENAASDVKRPVKKARSTKI